MKLINKKCPNCGASLSFEETDKKVKCEYCKQSIMIEREHTENLDIDEEFQLKVSLQTGAGAIQNKMLAFAVIILIAIIMIFTFYFFFKIFNFSRSFINSSEGNRNNSSLNSIFNFGDNIDSPSGEALKNTYVTNLSQINDKSLNKLKKLSLETLKKWTLDVSQGTTSTDWEYVGLYFLKHKSLNNNQLYLVYKKKYVVEKKEFETYGAVSYSNLKLDSDSNVTYYFDGFLDAPMSFVNNDIRLQIYGYSSNQDFYNKVIQSKTEQYIVSATTNLYIEL